MLAFTTLHGVAAPLLRDNVDTDAIIPSRESVSVSRDGYGERLFANWRYLPGSRVEDPTFVLNQAPYRQAAILIGGHNFGCGSSREAAAWSLAQFGLRCVIAKSFGEIFRRNCVRNGLLPVALMPDAVDSLAAAAATHPAAPIRVDLISRRVTAQDGVTGWDFMIDPLDREMLLEGLDGIALTLRHDPDIAAFQMRDRGRRPWIYARPDKDMPP